MNAKRLYYDFYGINPWTNSFITVSQAPLWGWVPTLTSS